MRGQNLAPFYSGGYFPQLAGATAMGERPPVPPNPFGGDAGGGTHVKSLAMHAARW
jgi:hypothetical protein